MLPCYQPNTKQTIPQNPESRLAVLVLTSPLALLKAQSQSHGSSGGISILGVLYGTELPT